MWRRGLQRRLRLALAADAAPADAATADAARTPSATPPPAAGQHAARAADPPRAAAVESQPPCVARSRSAVATLRREWRDRHPEAAAAPLPDAEHVAAASAPSHLQSLLRLSARVQVCVAIPLMSSSYVLSSH